MKLKLIVVSVWLLSCSNSNPASDYLRTPKTSIKGAEANPEMKDKIEEVTPVSSKTEDSDKTKEDSDESSSDPIVKNPPKETSVPDSPAENESRPKPIKFEGTLRIMPLGASFTQGTGSKKAGYRGFLHKDLDEAKIPHQFVGSNKDQPGDLPEGQTQHEGHPGYVITSETSGRAGITDNLSKWLGPKGADPQIITLLVGSNDVDINYKFDQIEQRYDAMISSLLDAEKGLKPNAILIVSTIALNSNPEKEVRTQKYNAIIKKIYDKRKAKGERIYLVDVHAKLLKSDMTDGLHANDIGYEKVGRLFTDVIKEAVAVENAK
ncbi:MAG: hypothetical protein EOP10_11990 [Proteobacteria bacterium]|nr:MAG: hypothetical protein EOP10_11990 [Pseudomonadota bacterium]